MTQKKPKTALKANVMGIMEALRETLPIFIPEDAMQAMMEGDFERGRAIFERASRIDLSQYPIVGPASKPLPKFAEMDVPQQPDYGSAGYGEMLLENRYSNILR